MASHFDSHATRWALPSATADTKLSLCPKGSIIEVLGGPFDGSRLMDVIFDGEKILMFTDDMKTHTEIIGGLDH